MPSAISANSSDTSQNRTMILGSSQPFFTKRLTGTGKRVFAMAPIHHHYEKKGWDEPKIIVRFWLISLLFALLALGTLKLR